MTRRSHQRRLLLLAAGVVALVLLAMALPLLQLQPARAFPLGQLDLGLRREGINPGPLSDGMLGPFRLLMTFFVWVLIPLTILLLIIWPDIRRRVLRRILLGIVWTVFIALVIRALEEMRGQRDDAGMNGQSQAVPPPNAAQVVPDFILHPPAWFVTVVSVVLAAALFFLVRWLMRRRAVEVPEAQQLEEIAAEAQSALFALRQGGDLRDTVLRCYTEMSRVVSSERGLQRPAGMTPREFELQLQRTGVQDAHIQRLTRLFERVRYGAQQAADADNDEAIACLTAIVQTYGAPA